MSYQLFNPKNRHGKAFCMLINNKHLSINHLLTAVGIIYSSHKA